MVLAYMTPSIEDVYVTSTAYSKSIESRFAQANPTRSLETLYDTLAALGISSNDYLLDLGCRDAVHSCAIAERFKCRVIGIDRLRHHIAQAKENIGSQSRGDLVDAVVGDVVSVPFMNGCFDFIWCREVLNHISDVPACLVECRRVLKPKGLLVIYQTFVTDSLTPAEEELIFAPLSIVPASMSMAHFESEFRRRGFAEAAKEVFSSEILESWEMEGKGYARFHMLRIARLQRNRSEVVKVAGLGAFKLELADSYWYVYQMIGKLTGVMYVLSRSESSAEYPPV